MAILYIIVCYYRGYVLHVTAIGGIKREGMRDGTKSKYYTAKL